MDHRVEKLYIRMLTSNPPSLVAAYAIKYLTESLDIVAYNKGMVRIVDLRDYQQCSYTHKKYTIGGIQ